MRAESPPSGIMFSFLKFNHKHLLNFPLTFPPIPYERHLFSQDAGALQADFPEQSNLSSPAIKPDLFLPLLSPQLNHSKN